MRNQDVQRRVCDGLVSSSFKYLNYQT